MVQRLRTPVGGAILLLALLAGPLGATARAADDGSDVYKRTLRSTVWVVSRLGDTNKAATGAGSLIDFKNRYILTNYHVVGDRDSAFVYFPILDKTGKVIAERDFYMTKGGRIPGKVVARDSKKDLALIQIERVPEDARALFIARESPAPGQRVHSLGNPGASGALWCYTVGHVRSVYHKRFQAGGKDGFEVDAEIVETDSPVNQGDSGGPVVNDKGELVAVTEGYRSDAQARLVTIFIDVSEVRKFLTSKSVAKIRTLPPPVPEKPKVEVAAKPTEDPAVKDEKEAARLLKLAKRFADDGFPDNARRRYKEIIDKFPKTPAAQEAKELLEKLNK